MKTNAVKEAYLAEIAKFGPSDYEYFKDDTPYQLSDGTFLYWSKPHIETRFCFGWDDSGQDYRDALDDSIRACEDQSFFIQENLAQFDRENPDITDIPRYNIYLAPLYWGEIGRTKLTRLEIQRYGKGPSYLDSYEPTDEDIEIIKAARAEQRALFLKRLQTYLKRYGLSKVYSWTYCTMD